MNPRLEIRCVVSTTTMGGSCCAIWFMNNARGVAMRMACGASIERATLAANGLAFLLGGIPVSWVYLDKGPAMAPERTWGGGGSMTRGPDDFKVCDDCGASVAEKKSFFRRLSGDEKEYSTRGFLYCEACHARYEGRLPLTLDGRVVGSGKMLPDGRVEVDLDPGPDGDGVRDAIARPVGISMGGSADLVLIDELAFIDKPATPDGDRDCASPGSLALGMVSFPDDIKEQPTMAGSRRGGFRHISKVRGVAAKPPVGEAAKRKAKRKAAKMARKANRRK